MRALRFAGFVVAVVALTGCQVRVAVDAQVERDGHGVLTVGVGLDDEALARVGDLERQVRVGDLTAAGWQVGRIERGPGGFTWIRATKPFSSVDELNRALAEVTGDPPVFRDFRLMEEDGGTATLHRLTGIVDGPKGMAAFADAQLGDRLGGDPVAAHVAAVEREEGRKLADLVNLEVTASVTDEATRAWYPRLDDLVPTRIDVARRDPKPATSAGGGAPLGSMLLAGVVVVVMLAGARQRFRAVSAPPESGAPAPAGGRPSLTLPRLDPGAAGARALQLVDSVLVEARRLAGVITSGPGATAPPGTNGAGPREAPAAPEVPHEAAGVPDANGDGPADAGSTDTVATTDIKSADDVRAEIRRLAHPNGTDDLAVDEPDEPDRAPGPSGQGSGRAGGRRRAGRCGRQRDGPGDEQRSSARADRRAGADRRDRRGARRAGRRGRPATVAVALLEPVVPFEAAAQLVEEHGPLEAGPGQESVLVEPAAVPQAHDADRLVTVVADGARRAGLDAEGDGRAHPFAGPVDALPLQDLRPFEHVDPDGQLLVPEGQLAGAALHEAAGGQRVEHRLGRGDDGQLVHDVVGGRPGGLGLGHRFVVQEVKRHGSHLPRTAAGYRDRRSPSGVRPPQ